MTNIQISKILERLGKQIQDKLGTESMPMDEFRKKMSELPEVKEVIKKFKDEGITKRYLDKHGFILASMIFPEF